ncbi:MAG: chemotaxis protein CheW [Deltaproteobacteria bacterium]|nr:chemotaxis protein CheW [Deltaproteobacteria bacterium]
MSADVITEATQYLTFSLGEEDFALEIAKVREVLDYTNITKVPRMPEFLRGVINLRGNVVPVTDLRLKLGMSATERTVNTCIVIVEIDVDGDLMDMGVLTDSVQAVLDLDPDQIEPPPKLGTKLNTEFIRGMGKRDDRFLIILDIDKVLSSDELAAVQSTGSGLAFDPKELSETEAILEVGGQEPIEKAEA